MALHATLLSLPAELALEEQMRSALRRSEEAFIQKMTPFYTGMVDVVGFHVRDVATVTYATLATLGARRCGRTRSQRDHSAGGGAAPIRGGSLQYGFGRRVVPSRSGLSWLTGTGSRCLNRCDLR